MHRYHILIITGVQSYNQHIINADGMMYSQSGVYEFWKTNDNGKRITIACFPINRTIIEYIQYDINE